MSFKSSFSLTVGQNYHDFRVTNVQSIPELHCQLIELIHEPSGAQVMHIANDDPENLFCLSFQTIPENSNGVAHILEHTVLCGSKKFPVKDPFFAMQRRSLNTFMNALTGADFTCYPAATQVPKDFYNLLDVYLNAVFHPILNELSFLQEGHRLEFSDPSDANSPLEYKGIVFNEMKGALTSPSSRLNEAVSSALFPDLTYGINSGGDPKDIPSLTYEELWEFHRKFYHPSRCLFFFYGNMPLKEHLDFIAKHELDSVEPVPALTPLAHQPRFKAPKIIETDYPISADEDYKDKALIAFGWLTAHILEQQELLALNILEIILMDTDASPLKRALLKSGLCKQLSCYMEDDISEVPLIIVLKGCNAESAQELEDVIKRTLREVIQNGISLDLVENAMHQLEFHRSEITGDLAPFGLSLFMRSALLKQHGGDPISGLKIHSHFDELRRLNLENPNYLTDLLAKYLLNNPHMVRITLKPSKELALQELAQEKAVLDDIKQGLSESHREAIVKRAAELAEFQKKQEDEDLDILPKVTFQDAPCAPRQYALTEEKVGNLRVFHHACFTNEIIYADLIFDLPDVAAEDLSYTRLFTTLLSQMGCGGRDYASNLEYIQANTGGVGSSLTFNLQAQDNSSFCPSLYIRGKALHRKAEKLFTLLNDLVTSVDFTDVARIKEVILKQYTTLQSSVSQNALKYSVNLSASYLDVASKIANQWYGLDYFWMVKELATNFDQQAEKLISKLKYLQTHLLRAGTADLVITSDAASYDELKHKQFYGLQDIETHSAPAWKGNYALAPILSQGRCIASPVAFTSKVFKTISYTHPDAPALNIAAFLCDNLTLHASLREQGGAYGGGAVSNAMAGNFYFYSYRDPNIATSLEAFKTAIKTIHNGDFELEDLEEAKLEMIQALDSPVSPGSRGDLAYGWLREGKTYEIRQAFRNRILSLSKQDVIDAVERHILPNFAQAATVVFASRELLEKENAKLIAIGEKPLSIELV